MSEEPLPDTALRALESALTGLAPLPADLSRDRMLFLAGQAALRRRGRLWPCAAAALAVLSATLGAALLVRPGPPAAERVVYVTVPAPAPAPAAESPAPEEAPAAEEAPPGREYLRLRQAVVEHGADALPPIATWPEPAGPAPRVPRAGDLLSPRGAS